MRAGAVVACAIPLTLAFVFPIMQMIDIDLQRISLGALIIALGLLVDDAMTAVDAMLRRLSAGDHMDAAASFAYTTLAFPMLTGSFITMAGFVPIGFARSSAGEYTFSIFAVVSIALVLSWVVAVIFTPLVGAALLRPPKETAATAGPGGSERLYRRLLGGALAAPWLTVAAALVAFAVSLAALDRVPRQFFPPSDRVELVVDLRLPQNASIFATEATVARFDTILGEDPDVERWSSYVGRGAIRFYLPLDVQLADPFFGQVVLVAKDVAARKRLEERLGKVLEEQFPEVVSRIAPLELGPPVGWPVQYRVSGPDTGEVRAIAMRLAQTDGLEPRRARRQLQLDGAGPRAAHPHRPGRGAPAGPELEGGGRSARDHGHGAERHPGPRRHLPGRGGRPRHRRPGACRWRACATCRWRCRTGGRCRSASSRPSTTARTSR